jgi:hypothetical protein
MTYVSDKEPSGLTALTSLASDDTIIVGDTSDASEVVKTITKANLKTDLGLTGTNTGDQTSIVGITGTKTEFDTACTDGNFLYVGDVTQYTDEMAQDAVGSMVATSIVYNDAGATLQRAALTGAITASQDSNTTSLGSFTKSQLSTAVSDGDVLFVGDVSSLSDGDKGDITVSGSGATWTIDNGVVTLAKQADMATASVVYRKTAGTGAPEVQTLATLKTDLGLTGTNTGDQTSIVGITGTMAQFDTAVTDGNIVYQSQALGTPSSGTLTNCGSLPVSGITSSTSTALGVGSLEIGHASDTTLSRASAGVAAIEGNNIVVNTSSPTLATITTTGNIELGHASDTTIARVSAGVASIEGNNIVTNTSSPTLGTITTTGNIELGNASDTTLSRSAAGVLAVEGVVIPSISSTNTLTNKRITKRTGTTTSSATPTINTDNVDFYSLTAQAVDITSFTTNLSGTPTEGQTLWIAITGTAARAITWGTSFESSTVTLPTTTVSTNRLDVGFVWNTVTSKWRCVASA